MSKKIIDLRSDTSSSPTAEMIESIRLADLGNDGFGEDPTVNELQELSAKMLGKEAALLVPSGVQGNLICILAQTRKGQFMIGEADCHIFNNEDNGYADFGSLRALPVKGVRGVMDVEEVGNVLESHSGQVGLITVENTHNRAGGTVIPIENLAGIKKVADANGAIKIHVDGSRLFNAAVALNVEAGELTKPADTVMLCLSKGLCAPVGSVIAGSTEFIESAHEWRRKLGGQMRQAGIIAAPGIVALKTMVGRLQEDQRKASRFATVLNGYEGIAIDMATVQTNIVNLDLARARLNAATLVSKSLELGVAFFQTDDTVVRAVFYNDISDDDVETAIELIKKAFRT